MITDEQTSAIDGLRSLGFEETGAYVGDRVFPFRASRELSALTRREPSSRA